MLLKKGEVTKKLTNEETIKIFLSSGWEEVKVAEKTSDKGVKPEEEIKDSKLKPNNRKRSK